MEHIGSSLKNMMKHTGWKNRLDEIRLKENWSKIMGNTIAKYAPNIRLYNSVLTIFTDHAPLKYELSMGKQQIIANVNEHFGEKIIIDVIVK